jgi:hypothetical protein
LAWGCGLDSTGSGQEPVSGCCECGDESSGSCATELVSYEDHISDIRHNRDKSMYALHMLRCRHEYGKIEETWVF